MMKKALVRSSTLTLAALVGVVALTGCATKKYVRKEVTATEERSAERIDVIQSQMENAEMRLAQHDSDISELSRTAQEALERAIAAGKLAEGRFLYETVLAEDKVRFGFDKAELSPEARAALDAFAMELHQRNEDVYIEIQGHTDSIGPDSYNLELGEERAEAVRRYLNSTGGLALHRMSVISYGESAPAIDENTREARAQNRRVTLVVLK